MSEYRKGGWKIGCLIFLGAISLSTVSAILMIMNSGKIAEKAEKAVSIYHNALKSGNCQQISAMKSSGRLKAKGLDVLEGACDVLKRKYGILRSSQATGSQLKIGSTSFSTSGGSSSGDYIVLQYVSTFSNSSVQETFTWKLGIGGLELDTYSIQDLALPPDSPSPNQLEL
jgi:hypothetical protein